MQETVNKDRDKYIGGSDIPIIMNLSPFKRRFDLLLEKAGYKEDAFKGNVFTEYGNTMEAKIREWINDYYVNVNNPFVEGKHVREAEADEVIGVRVHTDGENCDTVLEVKTTTSIHVSINDYKLYLVQLLFNMTESEKPYGLLAVYERPEDLSEEFDKTRLQLFDISIGDYEDLCLEIGEACDKFVDDLIKVKANPNITEEDLLPIDVTDIVKRILALESQLMNMRNISLLDERAIEADKLRLAEAMQASGVNTWRTANGYKINLTPAGVEIEEA